MKQSASLVARSKISFQQLWSKEGWLTEGSQALSNIIALSQAHNRTLPSSPLILSIQEGRIRAYLFPNLWKHKDSIKVNDPESTGDNGIKTPT
ncbi:MAG TPA: hypothetical protein VI935_01210 [Thermodesulfobacteriota bacterium]|nr:hypothetical protein [Thermodesulfobacteriota bacterium]